MTGRQRRLALAGLVALMLLTSAAVAAALMAQGSTGRVTKARGGEGPTALAQHLEQLMQAKPPGKVEGPREGPGFAADAEFVKRAYPDNVISVADMSRARTAFAAAQARGIQHRDRDGRWEMIGPSRAVYPLFEFRDFTGYVPNRYVAGGRTTAIDINSRCTRGRCVAYITPAGGGIWRTNNVFANHVRWTYLGGPLGINAAGAVTIDPNDPSGDTVYVGTGEANICGSGCVAGVGLYKSTNGGRRWTHLGESALGGKGIGAIVVKPGSPNTLYVGTTTALRGMSSVCCTGVTRPVPGAAKWGLYKSTNGGSSWSFIHNGSVNAADCLGDITEFNNGRTCSPRGVRNVALDPSNSDIVYASSFARGVWRSNDAGATWTQINPSLNATIIQSRPSIAVTRLANGNTRMYVAEGHTGAGGQYSRLFRSDDVSTGVPVFTDLTSPSPSNTGYATFNFCTGQCWYDQFVYTPQGHPDIVYVGGSYVYDEAGGISNARGVVLSTDAGVSATDMTMDSTDDVHPNGLHPDQHSMETHPNDPFRFVETNDGGVMRSTGDFVNRSDWCDDRGLAEPALSRCRQLLSRIPTELEGINEGLSTLQFQSLSVHPRDSEILQGGTQDNGTWETDGNEVTWFNTMIGDGGQSGFDARNPHFRFHTFFDTSPDVNFNDGATRDWIWIADPIFGTGGQFYSPIISDPVVTKTMFAGSSNVWRTKTHGLGTMTLEEAHQHCNEWTGAFDVVCGDWVQIADPSLTSAARGDRSGGSVAAVERTRGDTSTAWAATTTGRVFVSKNADADPASAVTWTRIDLPSTPGRFVSSIYVARGNPNRAWVSYSGFDVNTPTTPGHVFEVRYDPATGTATWTDRSYDMADIPVTDLVRDNRTGDLYAANDFGVLRLERGDTSWRLAASGMPNVEVAGLTIVPRDRVLFAATHGRSAWELDLDELDDGDSVDG
jgi:hypothetical protein